MLIAKEMNIEEIYANVTEMLLAGVDTVCVGLYTRINGHIQRAFEEWGGAVIATFQKGGGFGNCMCVPCVRVPLSQCWVSRVGFLAPHLCLCSCASVGSKQWIGGGGYTVSYWQTCSHSDLVSCHLSLSVLHRGALAFFSSAICDVCLVCSHIKWKVCPINLYFCFNVTEVVTSWSGNKKPVKLKVQKWETLKQ